MTISFRYALIHIIFLLIVPPVTWAACDVTVTSEELIQDIIDSSSSGDTICIEPGTYREHLIMKSGISLEGMEMGRTFIDGDGTGTVITADSDISVSKLIVTNGSIGISATSKNNITVKNIVVKNNTTAGIQCSSCDMDIINIVLDNNTAALEMTNSPQINLTNTIISDNSADISSESPEASFSFSSQNNNLLYNNDETNYPTGDASSLYEVNPFFVAASSNDYHLKTDSPAIDAGTGGNDPDGTSADIGAYGGPDMDTIPFPVNSITLTKVDDTTIDVSWLANNAYNITGYTVYYDTDPGEPYSGMINVGNVTTYSLTDLEGSSSTDKPTGFTCSPGNHRISCSWDSIPEASGYTLYYRPAGEPDQGPGEEPADYPNSIDAGNSTTAVAEDLINDTNYYFAVSAYFDITYYVSVSASDTSGNESNLVNEEPLPLLESVEGPLSSYQRNYPEETVAFPSLKDENKCFIATAAYGSPLERHVRVLRMFRNRFLNTTPFGRQLVRVYYDLSPPLAHYITLHPWARILTRASLAPLISFAWACLFLSPLSGLFLFSLLFIISFPLIRKLRARQ